MTKFTAREREILEVLKVNAGKTMSFEDIVGQLSIVKEPKNFRNSIMCSVRRVGDKTRNNGNPLQTLMKKGRGHKALFFIDETIFRF
jgi:hypothetical protein